MVLGQIWRQPNRWLGGIRHKAGMKLIQAQVWNRGTCHVDVKGDFQSETLKGIEYQCNIQGWSSDEKFVISLERRHGSIQLIFKVNYYATG